MSSLNFMIFDLYAVISNFAIKFSHNLIGSFFQWLFFLLRLLSLSSDESESFDNESDESFPTDFRAHEIGSQSE